MRLAVFLCLVLVTGSAMADTVIDQPLTIGSFDPADHSQLVTSCDMLAAHGDDPWSVAPGLAQAEIDFARAIPACEAAVARDPDNPRLRYQLGRLLGYSGQGEKAMEHRIKAVEAGYPQALFVIGYILLEGMNITRDTCLGADLIHRSAAAGRFAGLVGYPRYVLEGRFAACDTPQDPATLLAFIERAAAQADGFYQQSLVAALRLLLDRDP